MNPKYKIIDAKGTIMAVVSFSDREAKHARASFKKKGIKMRKTTKAFSDKWHLAEAKKARARLKKK